MSPALALLSIAGLLFLVEPLAARMLLPLFGGTPAVWTTCLLFFQTGFLGGTLYARLSTHRLGPRAQIALHAAVLAAAAVVLPIDVRRFVSPETPLDHPVFGLLAALTVSAGLPFVALSATSPLVQSWLARGAPTGVDPYRLYVASNIGSLAGLLSYPLWIEPAFDLHAQSVGWSIAYLLAASLVVASGAAVWKARLDSHAPSSTAANDDDDPAPGLLERVRWAGLAFIPASLTLGVTTYISTDIAAVPLVWVIPLSLYLISLAAAFARPRVGRLTRILLPAIVLPPFISILAGATGPAAALIPLHLFAFFMIAIACHQVLASLRPAPSRLAAFYLWLAAGGAAAGVFNVLAAPLVFRTPVEYPMMLAIGCYAATRRGPARPLNATDVLIALIAAALVAVCSAFTVRAGWPSNAILTRACTFAPPLLFAACLWAWPRRFAAALLAILAAAAFATRAAGQVLLTQRSFFGVHRVMLDETGAFREIVDGNIIHGMQAVDPARRRECLAYYSTAGPAGQTIALLRRRGDLNDVAVLGLGAGVLACHATPGQRWTFFEIDPVVASIARTPIYFTYLADAPGRVDVILGDARLGLDRSGRRPYNLIVLDVFSSDAIPVHLLTREALQLYLRHLAPGGVILFHTSNLYLDLPPIVGRLAADAGLAAFVQHHDPGEAAMARGIFPSVWVAVGRSAALADVAADERWQPATPGGGRPWTDDYSNVLAALRWSR